MISIFLFHFNYLSSFLNLETACLIFTYDKFANWFQSLTEDVDRQMEREKALQQKYGDLQEQIKELQEQYNYLLEELESAQMANSIRSTGSEEVSSTSDANVAAAAETSTTSSNVDE